ncbi:hypothetical protein F4678DRAFT_449897 [Xylaria arbuscula]|nr:hypothetical protein F4678DRAFT_449897 [Xylaria arbuscula]
MKRKVIIIIIQTFTTAGWFHTLVIKATQLVVFGALLFLAPTDKVLLRVLVVDLRIVCVGRQFAYRGESARPVVRGADCPLSGLFNFGKFFDDSFPQLIIPLCSYLMCATIVKV